VYPLIVGSLNYQKAGIFVQRMQYNSSNAKHCTNTAYFQEGFYL